MLLWSVESIAETVMETDQLVVVYPQASPIVANIYKKIIEGVKDGSVGEINSLQLQDQDNLTAQLSDKAMIALGSYATHVLLQRNLSHPPVVASVDQIEGVYGIRMIPDPAIVLQRLRLLVPHVKHIYMVVMSDYNLLDTEALDRVARNNGLQLNLLKALNIRDAAKHYKSFADELDSDAAVWIPPGDQFVNPALLSMMLDDAWESNFVVISSNPSHVNRGALFSVVPDYYQIGLQLAKLTKDVINETAPAPAKMMLNSNVLVSLNRRTANHLGIRITSEKQEFVDTLIPVKWN